MSAEKLHRMIFRPEPTPAQHEHPVRCAATHSGYSWDGQNQHHHACIHPARIPEGVVGLLEHQCNCGMTWIEDGRAETAEAPAAS